jgi:hypothetical protein
MEKLMAPDPRDRNFDKALARHFRPGVPSEESANLPAELGLQADNCPDAETLAAYHERSLVPAEMNSWKEHLVGCAHCQMVLAELEATENIPLHHAEKEEDLPVSEPKPAAVVQSWPVATAAPPRKTRMVPLSTPPIWRWLAPAGALAAILLVWISLHENQQPRFPSLNENKIAKKQEPSSLPGSVVSRAPTARIAQPKPPAAADEISASNGAMGSESLKQRERAQASAQLTSPLPSQDKESEARKDEFGDSSGALTRSADHADLDAKKSVDKATQNVEVQSQSAPVSNYQLNGKVPGPAPLSQAQPPARAVAKQKSEANAPAPAAAPAPSGVAGGVTAETTSNRIGAASQMVMVVSDPHLIYAPGAASQWRTGPSGLIEFSSNGGSSWSRQRSGVLVELQTGSAPSDRVCWIVGRVGAILLTTDAGSNWKLISSPLKEDLGGVQATDALHATIWNARHTKSFETSDGGLTWKLTGNP